MRTRIILSLVFIVLKRQERFWRVRSSGSATVGEGHAADVVIIAVK